jgi:Ni,Fe-hydrogenase III large subunit
MARFMVRFEEVQKSANLMINGKEHLEQVGAVSVYGEN